MPVGVRYAVRFDGQARSNRRWQVSADMGHRNQQRLGAGVEDERRRVLMRVVHGSEVSRSLRAAIKALDASSARG